MDQHTLKQKLHDVFKRLTPEVYYLIENEEHCVRIVSESFKNLSIAKRMVQVMKCVKDSPEMLKLDLQYDFNFLPMTPNELKNLGNNAFELETGESHDSSFENVAKDQDSTI